MAEQEVGLITFELREVRLHIDGDNEADVSVRVSASSNGELHWINASGSSFTSPIAALQKGDDGQLQACLEAHDSAVISLSRDVISSMANASVQVQLHRGGEGETLLATGALSLLEVLTAPNVNLNKRVQLQPHKSSQIQIAEGSFVACKVFADAELASFVLGGDFYHCASGDVFGVPQSWIEAATPQPPVIEQQFFLELSTEESQSDDVVLMVPTAPGVLTNPTEQQASEADQSPAVHFQATPYRFVHRDDLDAFRKRFGQGTAQLRLKHVLLTAPETTDKKKPKKNDAPPVETVTYYSANFAPNMEQFDAREVPFDLVLKREAQNSNEDAAQAAATEIEQKEETAESPKQPTECITIKLVYSMQQIWGESEEPIQVSMSLADVLPASTRSRPTKPPRDVDQELRFEIKDIISLVATEYTKLFAHNSKLTRDEKKAKFLHHLSVSGIYHSFKEKLKPRISRVVRQKFGPKQQALEATTAAEAGEAQLEFDEFLSKLFLHLLNESTSVLNAVYRDTVVELEECDVYDAATIAEDRETCDQKLARLQRWAMDAESAGRHGEAIKILMDRVNAALDDRSNDPELVRAEGAWMDLATAHLRSASEGSLETAQACLIEAVSAHAGQQNLLLLASTYLEQGLHEKAAACLFPDVWAGQSEEYQISALNPSFHVARSLCFHASNELGRAGVALQAAVKAHLLQRLKPEMHEQGRPRRTAVCVLLQNAQLYTKLNLFALARQAFDLAEQSEDACHVKAQARNMLVEAPAFHMQLMRRVQACLARQSVDADSKVVVETLLREALLYDVSAAENANCWIELGDFLFEMGDKQRALEAYKKAINIHPGQQHDSGAGAIQLRTYYRAGLLLLELGDHSGAQSIFLAGCATHQSALLWLGAGVSFLRQEMWKDAEKAIMEASHLDHTNPQIWGFFALLCLCSSTQRGDEAQQSIAQAFRLQLTDVGLLKEIALENIAVGKLQTAEDLLRRALGAPVSTRTALSYAQPTSRAMLRKLLADCLSGQHRAADAVDEYQKVASDPNATQEEQIEALSKCVPLLTTLGREEELASVEQSLQMLRAVAAAH